MKKVIDDFVRKVVSKQTTRGYMEGIPGSEPGTPRSAVECPTTELYPLARELQTNKLLYLTFGAHVAELMDLF